MIIATLKVFQSVKCGNREESFLTSKDFHMVLSGQLIKIVCHKSQETVYTPITNTPWWTELVGQVVDSTDNLNPEERIGQEQSLKDSKRTGKAKDKKAAVARPRVSKTK
jgi:hypothetical protein